MAIVFLGNNDATESGQFVSLEEFRSNMNSILSALRSVNPDMAIILPTPTRANKSGRSDEVTSKYADVVRDLAVAHPRNALVDLWTSDISIDAGDLCDGLHLGISGNDKLFRGIQRAIRARFPDFVPFNDSDESTATKVITSVDDDAKLHWRFPHWNKLAGKDIDESRAIIEGGSFDSPNN
jgi:hypothetical protein